MKNIIIVVLSIMLLFSIENYIFNDTIQIQDATYDAPIILIDHYENTTSMVSWDIQHCNKGKMPTKNYRCWLHSNEVINMNPGKFIWIKCDDDEFRVVIEYEYGDWQK